MDEYLDINKLKNETAKYQPIVDEHIKNDGFSFAEKINKQFLDDIASIVITNYSKTGPKTNVFYVIRIDRKHIELTESSENSKNNIYFEFDSKQIYLNKRPMGKIYNMAFSTRIRKILNDVKNNNATVYEENQ